MNITYSKTVGLIHIALVDVLLMGFICLVPAFSHIVALPLYKLNPMLLCLLTGMLLVNDRRNAYVMAVALPLVSMLLTGMPTPVKMLCIVPEMLTVVALFHLLQSKMPTFVAILIAALAGKGVFYLLKAVVIAPAVLIETNMVLQLSVLVLFAALFALLKRVIK